MDTDRSVVSERDVIHLARGGHNHDGKNSSAIELAASSVSVRNLDPSVIQLIENNSGVGAGISIPELVFTTNTIAPGGFQQGTAVWANKAIVIATKAQLNAASSITLDFFTNNTFGIKEFEAVGITDGFVYTGTWSHNDDSGAQQIYWRVTNTGPVAVQAIITLVSGTLGTNNDVPHVESIGLVHNPENEAPATGPVLFGTGTGVAIIRVGNTFTWSTAPYGQPIGPPPPIPDPQNLHVTTGLDDDVPFADAAWDYDPAIAGSDKVLQFYARLVKVGFGTVQTHLTPTTSWHIEPLEPDTDYTIDVQAQSQAAQFSSFAGPVSFHTPKSATIPTAPVNVDAGFGFKTVTLTWSDSVLNAAKIAYYEIELDTNNPISNVSPNYKYHKVLGQVDSFTNLVSGTTYYIHVRAVSTSGVNGPYSTLVSGTVGTINGIDFSDDSITAVNLDLVVGGDNKALNSSFEADSDGNGLADHWNLYGHSETPSLNNSIYYHGKVAQRIHVATGSGLSGVYQLNIGKLTTGSKYTVSCMVYPESTGTTWSLHATNADIATSPDTILNANIWQRIKYTFTATDVSTDVYVQTSSSNFWFEVDGFQVQEGDLATAYAPKPDEILPFTIVGDYIAQESIGEAHIENAAITNAKIGVLAVGTANVQDETVNTAKIRDLAVQTAKIDNLAVSNAKIGDLAVDNAKIANLAVDNAKIANATITDAKIHDLTVDKLTGGTITGQIIQLGSGGVFRADQTNGGGLHDYMIIDSAGIHFFKNGSSAFTGGTTSLDMSIGDGNAYFVGTVNASTISGSEIIGGSLNINNRFTVDSLGNLAFSSNVRLLDDDFLFYNFNGTNPILRLKNESDGFGGLNQWLMLGDASTLSGPAGIKWNHSIEQYQFDWGGSGGGIPGWNFLSEVQMTSLTRLEGSAYVGGNSYSGGIYPQGFQYDSGSNSYIPDRAIDSDWGFEISSSYTSAGTVAPDGTFYIYQKAFLDHRVSGDRRVGAYNSYDSTWLWFANKDGNLNAATSWSIFSSQDVKRDITSLEGDNIGVINALRPVTYNYITDLQDSPKRYGFIAEEVQDILPDLVTSDTEGSPMALDYNGIIPILVQAIKGLDARLVALGG